MVVARTSHAVKANGAFTVTAPAKMAEEILSALDEVCMTDVSTEFEENRYTLCERRFLGAVSSLPDFLIS